MVVEQLDDTSTAIAAAMEEQGVTTLEISRSVSEAAIGGYPQKPRIDFGIVIH